jgi:hypothetical protein
MTRCRSLGSVALELVVETYPLTLQYDERSSHRTRSSEGLQGPVTWDIRFPEKLPSILGRYMYLAEDSEGEPAAAARKWQTI